MADLTVYVLKSCDTCRKALADIRAADLAAEVVDVRDDGVPAAVLDRLVAGLGPEAVVNRRSTTWRKLDEETRTRALDPTSTASVMAAHPTLMKRPAIVTAATIHVGWTPAIRSALGA